MISVKVKTVLAFGFLGALALPVRSFIPWGLFGSISVLDVALLVGSVGLVFSAITGAKLDLGNRQLFLVLTAPLLVALLSLSWTQDPNATMKLIIVSSASVVAFLLTVWLFRDWSSGHLLRLLVLFGGGGVAVGAFSYFPGSPIGPEQLHGHRLDAGDAFFTIYYARFSHPFWGLTTGFATILGVLLVLLLVSSRGCSARAVLLPAVVILGGLLATLARGPVLAVGVVLGGWLLWTVLVRAKVPAVAVLVLLISVPTALLFFVISPEAIGFASNRLSGGGISSRLEMFQAAGRVVSDNVLFGVGGGVAFSDVTEFESRTIHNSYLQNLMWYGAVLGGGLTALMVVAPAVVATIKASSPRARQVRMALVLSVLFFVLVNLSESIWADGSVVRIVVYVLFGVGVLMIRAADREENARVFVYD